MTGIWTTPVDRKDLWKIWDRTIRGGPPRTSVFGFLTSHGFGRRVVQVVCKRRGPGGPRRRAWSRIVHLLFAAGWGHQERRGAAKTGPLLTLDDPSVAMSGPSPRHTTSESGELDAEGAAWRWRVWWSARSVESGRCGAQVRALEGSVHRRVVSPRSRRRLGYGRLCESLTQRPVPEEGMEAVVSVEGVHAFLAAVRM